MKRKVLISFLLVLISTSGLYAIDVKRLYEQGIEAFNKGNYGSSELLFRKVIENDGDTETANKAWFFLARTFFHQKKYEKSIYEFNSFLNKCTVTDLCNESHYWIGEAYYEQKKYIKAIDEYKKYITSNRKGALIANVHDRIGQIYFNQNRYDEAIIEWQLALKSSRLKEANAVRIFYIGEALFYNGQYRKALKRLLPLLTSNSDSRVIAQTRLIIGQIYQEQNNNRKALSMFNRIPERLLSSLPFVNTYFFKARSYSNLHALRSARNYYELFIEKGKQSQWYYQAHMELGSILLNGNDAEKGIALLEKIRTNSNDRTLIARASEMLSTHYIEKEPEKAVPYLKEAINTADESKKKNAILNLSKVYIKLEKYQEADNLLSDYRKQYPYDEKIDEVLFFLAIINLNTKKFNEAFDLFNTIQKEKPFSKFNNESKYFLAFVNYKKYNISKAIVLANAYLQHKNIEHRYEAYRLLLNCYLIKRNHPKSYATIRILLKYYINNAGMDTLLYRYIKSTYNTKYYKRYHTDLMVKKFPDSNALVKLYTFLGNANLKNKKYKQALYYYNRLLTGKQPVKDGQIFYNAILCLYNLKDYNQLIETIKNTRIPEMEDDKWKKMTRLLAKSYYAIQDYDKVYNTLLVDDMSVYQPHELLIFLKSSIYINDIPTALEWSDLLKKHKKKYTEFLYTLANKYKKDEDKKNAVRYYKLVIKNNSSLKFTNSARIELANLYFDHGQYKDSLNYANAVTDKHLQTQKTAVQILCYFELKEPNKAIALTKKYIRRFVNVSYGELVIKKNVDYYYNAGDIKSFKLYTNYLKKFKGNYVYINYLSAHIYYNNKIFRKAFYHFYKLSVINNEYQNESFFYLGHISFHLYHNKKSAIRYFTKITNDKRETPFFNRSKINLAIIYYEMKRIKESKQYLKEVIDTTSREDIRAKALNLYETFGF